MSEIHAEGTAVINARPEEVYAVLSDYHVGHPAILPRPPFTKLTVEEGGKGAGTVVLVGMKVMGREQVTRGIVTEPEPGHKLVETYPDSGIVTTFTVDPVNDGLQSRVTIATDARTSSGLQGLFERLMIPSFLSRVYKTELQQLSDYVSGKRAS
jgi:hypothetical protein